MTRTLLVLLAASTLFASAPVAFAAESNADCEDNVTWYTGNRWDEDETNDGEERNTQQGWIGYTTSQDLRTVWYNNVDSGRKFNNCEGEHWDGGDTVDGHNAGTSSPGCYGDVNVDGANSDVYGCSSADINDGAATPLEVRPVEARVTNDGSSGNRETYVGLDIALVGRAALYSGVCTTGSEGLEGAATCGGSTGESRQAIYLRDNTLGGGQNLLATVVSAAGITRGFVSEADCDQTTYQSGAEQNNRTYCGRDNTAITIELAP